MSSKASIIGLGNKARQGKDCTAEYLQSKYTNVFIVHWADALKNEVRNNSHINLNADGKRIHPLVTMDRNYYKVLDEFDSDGDPIYYRFYSEEVPYLHNIFQKRGIVEYWGDNDKDSEMLQFWGTDFRRSYCDQNYWVNKTMATANAIIYEYSILPDPVFILIPDTRFLNEYCTVKDYNTISFYWNIIRYNLDGSRYYDPNRDGNHPSETELDNVDSDYKTEAISGDLQSLYYQADVNFTSILQTINESK